MRKIETWYGRVVCSDYHLAVSRADMQVWSHISLPQVFPIPFFSPIAYAHPTISVKIVNQGHMPMTPTMSCWNCGNLLWVPLNHSLTQGFLLLVFLLLWNKPGKPCVHGMLVLWSAFWFWWHTVNYKTTNSLLSSCSFLVDVPWWGQLFKANEMEMRTIEGG